MLGIRRRRRVEGWSQEVSEAEAKGAPSTLWQRLGEDNRLWLIATGVIVIAAFWMIMNPQPEQGPVNAASKELPMYNEKFTDQEREDFAAWFRNHKSFSDKVLEASYVSQGNFRLVMPSNCSPDDIQYVARMAARQIEDKLRERAVVNVYLKKLSTGKQWKTATVTWNAERSTHIMKLEGEPEEIF